MLYETNITSGRLMTLFLVQSRGSGMSLVDRIDTLTAN
jgi:hypothetical protein